MACLDDTTLAALIEGVLPGAEREAAFAHADGCPACQDLLAEVARAAPRDPSGDDIGADVAPLVRGVSVGRYVVTDMLGKGAMGEVHAAYDPELDRKVALKIVRLEVGSAASLGQRRARMLREAQALAHLSHPNVVAVHDAGMYGDRMFIAMELVQGETLRQWLAERPRGWREILGTLVAAGRGLAAAHAVGMVHRDVKPDNILVARDGAVRVSDFGLARRAELGGADGEGVPGPADEALMATQTGTGAVAGTPAYMAPEQLRGKPAGPAADQFAFCATLFEALHGGRPFAGAAADGPGEMMAAIERGAVAPQRAGVPGWLRKVVLRGLAARPEDRYPSMNALLAALAHDPRVWWWRGAIAAGVIVTAGGALFLGNQAQSRVASRCAGSEAVIATAWNPLRKQAVHDAIAAGGSASAGPIIATVERTLDDYAAGWAALRQSSCEATQVQGTQSAELLDLREECLEREKEQLRAVADALAQPGPELANQAVKAAFSLPPLRRCEPGAVLGERIPKAHDAATQAKVDAARVRLADARALYVSGRYPAALAAATTLLEEARAIGYMPLLGEIEGLVGQIYSETGKLDDALARAEESFHAAAAGGDEHAATAALTQEVWILGVRQGKRPEARERARLAQALVDRLTEPENGATLGYDEAILRHMEGDYAGAEERFERALAERIRIYGPEHPLVGATLDALGVNNRLLGRLDQARDYYERALAMNEKLLGPDHPSLMVDLNNLGNLLHEDAADYDGARKHLERALALARQQGENSPMVGSSLVNLAAVFLNLGEIDRALEMIERALPLEEAGLGADHPLVSWAYWRYCEALDAKGRYDDALTACRRALDIRTRTVGPDHFDIATTINTIADIEVETGHPDQGIADSQRALAMTERVFPPGHPGIATSDDYLCYALVRAGRGAEAMPPCREALALGEKIYGPSHPNVTGALTNLGEAQLLLGRVVEARELLERAVAILEPRQGDQALAGRARFALARIVAESDPPRAHALATRAAADLVALGSKDGRRLAEVNAWLAAHPAAR